MMSDDLEAQAAESERDKKYEHYARADSEGDNDIQSVVHGDGTKAQLETPEDNHGYNENGLHSDDLKVHPNRPQNDDLHTIVIMPRD